jgi:ABC-2 type transport system permease protein
MRRYKPLVINAHIIAVIENEWSQMKRNRVIMITTFAPPFLFVGLALMVLYLSRWIDLNYITLEKINDTLKQNFQTGETVLSHTDSIRAALLNPFLVLFEMLPIVVPLTIASYSIIGEKQTRSLETLLATPIRTWELLVGKAFAAALPGVAATWYSFAVFVFAAKFTVSSVIYRELILSPTWLITITLMTPIFTMFAVCLGIIISSRVKDPQSAQQLGSLLVLPMVGLMIGQISGLVSLHLAWILAAAVGIALVDAFLLVMAVRLFKREAILTSWR